MPMSDSPFPSIVIFVVFGALALALVVVVLMTVYERMLPLIERHLQGVSLREAVGGWFSSLGRRRRRVEDDDSDDLDDDTAALLSLVSHASLVVDEHDGVVRANPEAYRLGVVVDDELREPSVLAAVRQVRKSGGRKVFDIETRTPERFIGRELGASESDAGDSAASAQGVSRPNWLKVTVGRINGRFVIVLLDDVSETIRLSQVRDSFIINVSEQLLKPTEALERLSARLEGGAEDPEDVRRDAAEVRQASRHLNHLVSDLLLLIRAQEPITPATANRLNVMELLGPLVERLAPAAREAGVSLRLDGSPDLMVNGDAEQIEAAVTKLVENAVAYSPAGASVSVSATASSDGGQAVIRVIDQGTGIAKADQTRIFERFYRGDNQSERSADGVGLGLAIVKHVALTHHGSAGVWSAPGQGSTFSLSLPIAV